MRTCRRGGGTAAFALVQASLAHGAEFKGGLLTPPKAAPDADAEVR